MLELADLPMLESWSEEGRERSKKERSKWVDIDDISGAKDLRRLGKGIVEKEKRKDCKKGNKNHDEDGRFSTKKDAESWAGGYSGREDCYYGKWKYKGGKNKLMTRHKCGRKDDGTKHKFRCKDGTEVYEEELTEAFIKCVHGSGGVLALFEELGAEFMNVQEGQVMPKEDRLKTMCHKMGYMTFRDFLLKINWIERARDGKLLSNK